MADALIGNLQKSLQKELDEFRNCQKDYHKAIIKRQQLDAQLNENSCVKSELDLISEGSDVFKLIGPVLIKQDVEEAKQNVAKRIQYISSELKRLDEMIAEMDKKEEKHRESLQTLQKSLQEATLAAKKSS